MATLTRRVAATGFALALGTLAVACGSDSNDTNTDTNTSQPSTSISGQSPQGTGAPEDVNPNDPGADDEAPVPTGPVND